MSPERKEVKAQVSQPLPRLRLASHGRAGRVGSAAGERHGRACLPANPPTEVRRSQSFPWIEDGTFADPAAPAEQRHFRGELFS
jgi:hypothetical protein